MSSFLFSQVDIVIQSYLLVILGICFPSLTVQKRGPANTFFLFGVKIFSQWDLVFYFHLLFSNVIFPFVKLIMIFVILLLF